MQISSPANFDFRLLKRLKGKVHDTYGSLNCDPYETVLPDYTLPRLKINKLKDYIKYSHDSGIKFDYVMNHPYLTLNKERMSFLDKLNDIKVDIITLTSPEIISFVKRQYPIKISTSVACNIDSLDKAMIYKELGCNIVCICHSKNYDLEFINLVKSKTGLAIKILVNNICLSGCPYVQEHFEKVDYFEKQIIKCLKIKLNNIDVLKRGGFIHPNDIKKYEDLGVDFLKIGGRTKPSGWIANCVEAYAKRNYNGNCFSLANVHVLENNFSAFIITILLLLPEYFIRIGLLCLYYLSSKKIFNVLSRENKIKPLLRLYTTKDFFYMDDKTLSINTKKKNYLLKQINEILGVD